MRLNLAFLLFFLSLTNIYAQNIYKLYKPNDTSQGQRLKIGNFNLASYNHTPNSDYYSLSVGASFAKWKFTPKILWAVSAITQNNARHYSSNYITSMLNSTSTNLSSQINLVGGLSYYLKPDKFYISLSGSTGYYYYFRDGTEEEEIVENMQNYIRESKIAGSGYVSGAIGFGRIYNALNLEYGLFFSESLVKSKMAKTKLSDKSLFQISSLIYKFRNGDFKSKYKDDAAVGLFKETEKVLLQNNDIALPLDAENAVRLYEILSNATGNYFIYPRYQGYQIQTQFQYEVFGTEKPHNHHMNISGIYGIPISERNNLLISGYISLPIDMLANYAYSTAPYVPEIHNHNFFVLYPDYNNLSSFTTYTGTGLFNGGAVNGDKIDFSIMADFTHSFNSFAGITLNTSYFKRIYKDDYDNPGFFTFNGRLDYNIYSALTLSASLNYNRTLPINYLDNLSVIMGAFYTIF